MGVTIGLFVLAGATLVVTEQVTGNKRLMLETQLQQDLRAAADIIARDIRRSAYYGNAAQNVWPATPSAASAAVAATVYAATTPASTPATGTDMLLYRYSTDRMQSPPSMESGTLDASRESFGVRLNAATQALQMRFGASGSTWQDLTDPNVEAITDFKIVLNDNWIYVPCVIPCPGGPSATCPPRLNARDATITIEGTSRLDPTNVKRQISATVRLRNDTFEPDGACPAS
ncbi:MAG: hypothetical protein HY021_00300 [Burkholderiales bacterium]|nr:hypothetical protein [Burkholderiales bacterium]